MQGAGKHSCFKQAARAEHAVDLASQLVLSVAERSVSRYHPGFPIGRGKLEALAVIGCACIMSIASLEVAQFSAIDLYHGFAKGALAIVCLHAGSKVRQSGIATALGGEGAY